MSATRAKHGYCQCGCGDLAPVSDRNHTKYGWVKGQPKRYIRGHSGRGQVPSAETRERLRVAMTGRVHTWGHKISAAQRGEGGPNWQGGRITREGRVLVYVGREHVMADMYGYVYEHRLVFAAAAGRALTSSEHVHHVDLNPANNVISNLVVLTNSEHRRVHNLISIHGLPPLTALQEAVCR